MVKRFLAFILALVFVFSAFTVCYADSAELTSTIDETTEDAIQNFFDLILNWFRNLFGIRPKKTYNDEQIVYYNKEVVIIDYSYTAHENVTKTVSISVTSDDASEINAGLAKLGYENCGKLDTGEYLVSNLVPIRVNITNESTGDVTVLWSQVQIGHTITESFLQNMFEFAGISAEVTNFEETKAVLGTNEFFAVMA